MLPDLDDDAVIALIKEKDQAVAGVAAELARKLDSGLFPAPVGDEGAARVSEQQDPPADA